MAKTVPAKKSPREAKRQAPDAGRVTVDGDLTLLRLQSFRAALSGAIASAPAVTVDCSGATGAHLGLIQLILSARKTAAAAGKSVALTKPATGEFLDTLRRAGLVSAEGAPPAFEQAFWQGAAVSL